MKRYIVNILLLAVAFFVSSSAWGAVWNKEKTGEYTLDKNVTVTEQITVDGTLKITATKDCTIKAGGNIKRIFYVPAGSKLVIDGDNYTITIDGGATLNRNESTGVITKTGGYQLEEEAILNRGTLTLKKVHIKNVYVKGPANSGGAILIQGNSDKASGKTTLNNCKISYCVSDHGAAVHVGNQKQHTNNTPETCAIDLKNTTIEYCYARAEKAGGEITEGGVIRTNGGCVGNLTIQNCTVQYNHSAHSGGGLYWNGKGKPSTKLYLKGSTFTNNTAVLRGAGMMLETDFTFESTETKGKNIISNNRTTGEDGYGGGIVITSYGGNGFPEPSNVATSSTSFDYDFNTHVEIENNEAVNGAGVYFSLGNYSLWDNFKNQSGHTIKVNVKVNNSVISSNKASNLGGGIYLHNTTKTSNPNHTVNVNLYLNSGEINNNSADNGGGGIYTYNTSVSCNDATNLLKLEGNTTSAGNGSGIYVNGGQSISLGKVSISDNSAPNGSGGAIYLSGTSGTSFKTSQPTTISDNYCKNDGGAIYVSGGTVSLNNPTVTGNGKDENGVVKTANGGAVYVTGTGSGFIITGTSRASITDNASIAGGGAIYVNGGSITVSDKLTALTLEDNHAKNGGAFYVNGGNITATNCQKATIKNNYSTADGGAFYVNNGNIYLCSTELSGNGYNNGSISTINGGAIALFNGVFEFANDSEIKNNAASGNGGALYVMNTETTLKEIICTGGSYMGNKGGLGGGIYASGNIELTFAANVRDNIANNGGGLYLANGLDMYFGDGLIVGNIAELKEGVADDGAYGRGGGIYVESGTLSFTERENLGIYNNSASYEAADIYASGNGTTIYLPYVKGMNLKGFDVPGSELYWVEDFHESRYEAALVDLSKNIEEMIVTFEPSEITAKTKVITEYTCLDLGYDLVFVTLKAKGLQKNDAVIFTMSYTKNPNTSEHQDFVYRKAMLKKEGEDDPYVIVGLPSGNWKFATTAWSKHYTESYAPEHVVQKEEETGENYNYNEEYINIKRQGLNGKKDNDTQIVITFTQLEDYKRNQYRKINKMTTM